MSDIFEISDFFFPLLPEGKMKIRLQTKRNLER